MPIGHRKKALNFISQRKHTVGQYFTSRINRDKKEITMSWPETVVCKRRWRAPSYPTVKNDGEHWLIFKLFCCTLKCSWHEDDNLPKGLHTGSKLSRARRGQKHAVLCNLSYIYRSKLNNSNSQSTDSHPDSLTT